MSFTTTESLPISVVAYMRMSTDHQQFSIDNQLEFISKYATDHNMTIIRIYDDEGKSGVSATGRNSFLQMIQDVVTGELKIEAVLVYDVSRFGRFQDNDEAGHYSYLLKMHGVKVIYCAENLPEHSPEIQMLTLPALRYAAGAYSRNLSIKVFAGHVNLVNRGFFQGGSPGYGLRRKLVDAERKEKFILQPGERKSLQTDRVILVHGPDEEIKTIKRIFNLFIFESCNEYLIADKLNREGIYYHGDKPWSRSNVHSVLINSRLIGSYIYNKSSKKLKSKKASNPEEKWVRHDNFLEPVISREKFSLAQKIIYERSMHLSDDDVLKYLKDKLTQYGKLSGFIINEDPSGPSSSVISNRFGGLINAYQLIGYTPDRDYRYIKINKELRNIHTHEIERISEKLKPLNVSINNDNLICINDNLKISIVPSRCKLTTSGKLRWIVRLDRGLNPDVSIVMRMNSLNTEPVDFYVLPQLDEIEKKINFKESNSFLLELYRFDDLNTFLDLLSYPSVRVA